jgi:hypothetical protein
VLQTRQDGHEKLSGQNGREELGPQERFLYAKWSLVTDGDVSVTGVMNLLWLLAPASPLSTLLITLPRVTGVIEAEIRWRVYHF